MVDKILFIKGVSQTEGRFGVGGSVGNGPGNISEVGKVRGESYAFGPFKGGNRLILQPAPAFALEIGEAAHDPPGDGTQNHRIGVLTEECVLASVLNEGVAREQSFIVQFVQMILVVPGECFSSGPYACLVVDVSKEITPFDREFPLALDLSFDHGDHGEVSEAPLAGKAPVCLSGQVTFEPVDLAAAISAAASRSSSTHAVKKAWKLSAGRALMTSLSVSCKGIPFSKGGKMVEQMDRGHQRPPQFHTS